MNYNKMLVETTSKIEQTVNVEAAGKILYVTVSGAHLYGFPSVNSDVDLRGCYMVHPNLLLGLRKAKDCFVSVNPDYQMFELKKEVGLILNGNCNVLEHVFSTPYKTTPEYFEFKQLVSNAINKKGVYDSYRGMATFNYKKFILGGKKSYKKYLYVFRALLAGLYFLETGKIEPNINVLLQKYPTALIQEVVEKKKLGEEIALMVDETKNLDILVSLLFERLDDGYVESSLPVEIDPEDFVKLNRFVLKQRLKMLGEPHV